MDLHAPAHSSASVSNDGIYDLAEAPAPAAPPAPPQPPAADTPAPADVPAPAPADAGAAEAKVNAKGKDKGKEPADGKALDKEAKAKIKKKRRRRKVLKIAAPAWAVSLVVHVAFLVVLGAMTLHSDAGKKLIANIDAALGASPRSGEEEMSPIYADPGNERSDTAVGNEGAEVGGAGGTTSGTGTGGFGGIGTGPPSATPAIGRVARVGDGSGGTGLGSLKIAANVSGLSMMPAAPGLDLGGGGGVVGDVTYEAKDVGQSLDQIAREILRHLTQHKLIVVWLFDESESMKDDQKAVKQKFDRIVNELKLHAENESKKKVTEPLTHVIASFGNGLHFIQEKPTADIEAIGQAIDKIPVDETGDENTLHALGLVIDRYSSFIKKDRRLLVVLVTDESGDDGAYVEEAHQAVVGRGVPIYTIGRQSLFGYQWAHLQYIDPITKDVYWPRIRRGPETADVEMLQWDGLHDRWDEQPSGFAPYELARLSKDSGGIYFLLPSEENMRVRQREKAYRIADLKEYVPDYKSRLQYLSDRNKSEFRRTMYEIIQATKWNGEGGRTYYRRHFPINPVDFVPAAEEAQALATERLNQLLAIQARLEKLQKLRDREPEKRWQAHYDLMLAQIIVYQIKSYEYRACLQEMVREKPKPKTLPTQDLVVEWVMDHSHDRKAPKENTEKKYVEATKLLKEVIARHPKTPWADLAQDEFNRGMGVQRNEWHHNPRYEERSKLVPKY